MKNRDLREAARSAGLKLWQIAEKLNISDGNFSRKLRKEFSDEQKANIMQIIEEISKEGS